MSLPHENKNRRLKVMQAAGKGWASAPRLLIAHGTFEIEIVMP